MKASTVCVIAHADIPVAQIIQSENKFSWRIQGSFLRTRGIRATSLSGTGEDLRSTQKAVLIWIHEHLPSFNLKELRTAKVEEFPTIPKEFFIEDPVPAKQDPSAWRNAQKSWKRQQKPILTTIRQIGASERLFQ